MLGQAVAGRAHRSPDDPDCPVATPDSPRKLFFNDPTNG
jgi:hypothetical protein